MLDSPMRAARSRSSLRTGLTVAAVAACALASPTRAQCGESVAHVFLDSDSPSPVALRSPDGAAVAGGPFSLRVEGGTAGALGALVWSANEVSQFDPTYQATIHVGLLPSETRGTLEITWPSGQTKTGEVEAGRRYEWNEPGA